MLLSVKEKIIILKSEYLTNYIVQYRIISASILHNTKESKTYMYEYVYSLVIYGNFELIRDSKVGHYQKDFFSDYKLCTVV